MYHPVAHPDMLGSQHQRESTGSFPDILQPPCQRRLGDFVRVNFSRLIGTFFSTRPEFINDVEQPFLSELRDNCDAVPRRRNTVVVSTPTPSHAEAR